MDIKKEQKIKAQEWVVMFDGQIKKSENEIDSYEHNLEVDNQKSEEWRVKSEEWLAFSFIEQIREIDIFIELLNFFLFKVLHFL